VARTGRPHQYYHMDSFKSGLGSGRVVSVNTASTAFLMARQGVLFVFYR